MNVTPEMVVIMAFSFFSFFFSSSFVLLLKNRNKISPTPQGSIPLMWFTYIVTTFCCVIIFLTPLTQESIWLLIATDLISIIFPLFIPGRSIEKLYPTNVSSRFHAVGVNVKFKPEFNTYKIIWLCRYLLVILLILIFFLYNTLGKS